MLVSLNESSNESSILSEWESAASPDLHYSFYVVSAVWLAFCGIFGITFNGIVLLAFYKDCKVNFRFLTDNDTLHQHDCQKDLKTFYASISREKCILSFHRKIFEKM